ncbi:nose resistant to fluoxetine protein 6-like [Mizuhopecten yessoensis]|nr:nose resistant to fluoxetine protein 6-like [Mizuhopecten yessoensis]
MAATGDSTGNSQNLALRFLFQMLESEFSKTYRKQNNGVPASLISDPVLTYANILGQMNLLPAIMPLLGTGSARTMLPYNSSVEEDKISDVCYEDMIDFIDAANDEKEWALRRLDSYGKIPSGLAKGNINFLGSFDQCLKIRSDIKANEILGGIRRNSPRYPRSVGSKYCRVRIPLPKSIVDGIGVETKGIGLKVTWGTCIPDTCTGNDVYGLLKLDVFKNATSMVESVDCTLELDITQDLAAVLTIMLLSILAFLMLTGTLYVSMESRGDIADNDKSANADSAYSNLTFTNVDESKPCPTLNEVKVENGHTAKEGEKGRKEIGLLANYVPHSESDKSASDKTVDTITDQPNGVSNGGTGTKAVSLTQETNAKPSRQKKEGVLVRIVKAFSIQINAPKILTGRTGLNSIKCIHGIKFFTITWVILNHTYNYGILSDASTTLATANFGDALSMIQRFTFQIITAGGFAVDTFFVLSAMLLTYTQLKRLAKLKTHLTGPKIGSYAMLYFFHRFWRLTPMYVVVLLIFATLLPYLGSGPLWPNVLQTSEDCKQSWWTNLLYINNIVKVDSQCMGWTWFLSNDMQFYVVSIFLLFFMTLSLPLGLVLSTLLFLVGSGVATWQAYVYNGNILSIKSDNGKYWKYVYIAPWSRFGGYCVGLFLGVIFYKRPRKAFSKIIGYVGWTIATAVALTLVYSTYSANKEGGVVWTNVQTAFYEGFGRPVWSLCVAWVIFACHNDMGGYVNSILSWKALVPLSRLSFSVYLIHPVMMITHVYSKRSLVYLTDYDMIYLFVGHTIVSYMAAFILALACEAPFMALEKLLFGTI